MKTAATVQVLYQLCLMVHQLHQVPTLSRAVAQQMEPLEPL